MTDKGPTFRKEIAAVINRHSKENGSDTPDFLLAEYLSDCLDAFDRTTKAREKWYGREPERVMDHLATKGQLIVTDYPGAPGQSRSFKTD
jgi:hypothetical protein